MACFFGLLVSLTSLTDVFPGNADPFGGYDKEMNKKRIGGDLCNAIDIIWEEIKGMPQQVVCYGLGHWRRGRRGEDRQLAYLLSCPECC